MTLKDAVAKTERNMIREALDNHDQDQMKASVALGIHITSLWRKRKAYDI